MVNVNKLFPRLSIRHKLAVAFAGVAMIPLLIISISGSATSVRQLEEMARSTVDHDLRLAETLTAMHLEASERYVEFLSRAALAAEVRDEVTRPNPDVDRAITKLVGTQPILFRVKAIDSEGRERLVISSTGIKRDPDPVGRGSLYAWHGERMTLGSYGFVPVELSGTTSETDSTVAAIAVVLPVFDTDGSYVGVVVGEMLAAGLMTDLEHATPGYTGVTALVDADGHYLYHSIRKRDWARLLADRDRVVAASDLSPSVAAAMLRDTVGVLRPPNGALVSYRRLRLGSASNGPTLTLYRMVDAYLITAPVRRFLRWVLAGGALVIVGVVGVAVVAGEQLTRPIRRVQEGMWRLARGEPAQPPEVATNDEIEDLARDFKAVATLIAHHRAEQDAQLTDRTQALAVTHAELSGIVAHSADAIIGTDAQGRVRLWNGAAARLFGYTDTEATDRDLVTLLSGNTGRPPDDQRFIDAELARTGSVTDFRTTRRAKNGADIPVSLSQACVRDAKGAVVGYSVIARDRRSQELLDAQMRRSERLAATSVVAASIAHEINNPLAVVANRIELMQRELHPGAPGVRFENDLDVLKEHVRRASEVTRDLLRFAREGSDTAEPVELVSVVVRICGLLRRTVAARGLRLEHEPAQDLGQVIANEKAVESVLLNLLLNAADATPAGGTIRVLVRRAGSCSSSSVEVVVEDSGPGIPAELRDRIFEPFFTTKEEHGTGLGLTVCRSIVERFGGKIDVRSSELGGAAFVVSFSAGVAEHVA